MKKVILISMFAAAFAFADSELDSLRLEIERLNAQLEVQRLNAELARIREEEAGAQDAKQAEGNINLGVQEIRNDTVTQDISAVRRAILENREWRRNNIMGIGGGPVVGAMALDTRPIRNYLMDLQAVPDRQDQTNPFRNAGLAEAFLNREPTFVTGGFGYGNFGNGAIVGGGGYGFFTQVRSKVADTTFTARILGGYGGLIVGGGWSNRKSAFSLTSLIGAGAVTLDVEKKFRGSIFEQRRRKDRKKEWGSDNDILDVEAVFFAFEPQIAYTHSFLRWFHVGVEAAGLIMYSPAGFDLTEGFKTFNPSAKLRFVFGSI